MFESSRWVSWGRRAGAATPATRAGRRRGLRCFRFGFGLAGDSTAIFLDAFPVLLGHGEIEAFVSRKRRDGAIVILEREVKMAKERQQGGNQQRLGGHKRVCDGHPGFDIRKFLEKVHFGVEGHVRSDGKQCTGRGGRFFRFRFEGRSGEPRRVGEGARSRVGGCGPWRWRWARVTARGRRAVPRGAGGSRMATTEGARGWEDVGRLRGPLVEESDEFDALVEFEAEAHGHLGGGRAEFGRGNVGEGRRCSLGVGGGASGVGVERGGRGVGGGCGCGRVFEVEGFEGGAKAEGAGVEAEARVAGVDGLDGGVETLEDGGDAEEVAVVGVVPDGLCFGDVAFFLGGRRGGG